MPTETAGEHGAIPQPNWIDVSMLIWQLSRQNLSSFWENLRYANLGMKEGVITLSNVMEAQTAWLKAKSEWVNAQVDVRLANLYLRKAVGSIDTHI